MTQTKRTSTLFLIKQEYESNGHHWTHVHVHTESD